MEVRNFSIGYGNNILIKDVSLKFGEKKLTALIGRNGSGKSTFIRALAAINSKYVGEIIFEGKNLREIPRHEVAKLISFVSTQRPRLSNLKCIDIVALGRTPHSGWLGKLTNHDKELVDNALDMVGMKDYSQRYINSLSDGECQKIMMARAIAQDTKIMLLDEPTSFLDLPTRYEMVKLLKNLAAFENKTIVFSTHELDIALRYCDEISLFSNKSIKNYKAEDITMEQILSEWGFQL